MIKVMINRLVCFFIGCNDSMLQGSIDCETPPVRNILVYVCHRCGVVKMKGYL